MVKSIARSKSILTGMALVIPPSRPSPARGKEMSRGQPSMCGGVVAFWLDQRRTVVAVMTFFDINDYIYFFIIFVPPIFKLRQDKS
jgi:hypothetical protein